MRMEQASSVPRPCFLFRRTCSIGSASPESGGAQAADSGGACTSRDVTAARRSTYSRSQFVQAAAAHVHDEGREGATALVARPYLEPRPAHGVEANEITGAVQVPVSACCSRMVSAAVHAASSLCAGADSELRAALELLAQVDGQWQCKSKKSSSFQGSELSVSSKGTAGSVSRGESGDRRGSLTICGNHDRTSPIQRSGDTQGWTVFHLPSIPGWSDPASAVGNTAGSPRHPCLHRPPCWVQSSSSRAPAFQGEGSVVNCLHRIDRRGGRRRRARLDGRLL
jgi:hypothetical protein